MKSDQQRSHKAITATSTEASVLSVRPVSMRMREYVQARGGPAKDDDGAFIGTCWPMMLEAADRIDALVLALAQIASGTEDEAYPFRAMERQQMARVAEAALLANIHSVRGAS